MKELGPVGFEFYGDKQAAVVFCPVARVHLGRYKAALGEGKAGKRTIIDPNGVVYSIRSNCVGAADIDKVGIYVPPGVGIPTGGVTVRVIGFVVIQRWPEGSVYGPPDLYCYRPKDIANDYEHGFKKDISASVDSGYISEDLTFDEFLTKDIFPDRETIDGEQDDETHNKGRDPESGIKLLPVDTGILDDPANREYIKDWQYGYLGATKSYYSFEITKPAHLEDSGYPEPDTSWSATDYPFWMVLYVETVRYCTWTQALLWYYPDVPFYSFETLGLSYAWVSNTVPPPFFNLHTEWASTRSYLEVNHVVYDLLAAYTTKADLLEPYFNQSDLFRKPQVNYTRGLLLFDETYICKGSGVIKHRREDEGGGIELNLSTDAYETFIFATPVPWILETDKEFQGIDGSTETSTVGLTGRDIDFFYRKTAFNEIQREYGGLLGTGESPYPNDEYVIDYSGTSSRTVHTDPRSFPYYDIPGDGPYLEWWGYEYNNIFGGLNAIDAEMTRYPNYEYRRSKEFILKSEVPEGVYEVHLNPPYGSADYPINYEEVTLDTFLYYTVQMGGTTLSYVTQTPYVVKLSVDEVIGDETYYKVDSYLQIVVGLSPIANPSISKIPYSQ